MIEKTNLIESLKDFTVKLMETVKPEQEAKVELSTMKLDDNVTILEADAFEAGQAVMILTEDEQRIPLPVNEEGYKLEDGRLLIVKEEGIIDSIEEVKSEEAAEEPAAEEPAAEVAQSEKATVSPVAKKIVEAVTRESHFSSDVVEKITENVVTMLSEFEEPEPEVEKVEDSAEVLELKAEIAELKKKEDEPAEGEIKHNPEAKSENVNFSVSNDSMMSFLNGLD